MNWLQFSDTAQIENIILLSQTQTVLLFKHSTRCSISSMALSRLERAWKDKEMEQITPYFIDLIANRNVSTLVAQQFEVEHESPQVLLIKKGICTYHNSHGGISYQEIKDHQ
jgi:bacillithiol system protein YtxJ